MAPPRPSPPAAPPGGPPAGVDHGLLLDACRGVLLPLARLAVERGVPYAQVDEVLRAAFVEAARGVHPGAAAQRGTSRLSAATGLTRREVARLSQPKTADAAAGPPRRSPATEAFTRWLTDPQLRPDDAAGAAPRTLPRQGPAPSFESLAQSVTKDVHPRTLLEEMLRLGLAGLDDDGETVALLRDTFVPSGDEARLFGFLGANVGDHLAAAVANVLSAPGAPRHLEQAVFADGMSAESIERLRPALAEQWQTLARALVPRVRTLIDDDRDAGRVADRRLRVGLYAYSEVAPDAAAGDGPAGRPAPAPMAPPAAPAAPAAPVGPDLATAAAAAPAAAADAVGPSPSPGSGSGPSEVPTTLAPPPAAPPAPPLAPS